MRSQVCRYDNFSVRPAAEIEPVRAICSSTAILPGPILPPDGRSILMLSRSPAPAASESLPGRFGMAASKPHLRARFGMTASKPHRQSIDQATAAAICRHLGAVARQTDHQPTVCRVAWRARAALTKGGALWLIKVETSIGRYKRVIGDALRSRTDQTEATEVAIAAVALNRMLALGRPNYVRIA
jgi:hypothetical protein